MSDQKLLLGIDGGGSKTLALIADESGKVIGRGVAESSNYHTVGKEKAFASLDNAINSAFENAKLGTQNFYSVCIGMAGIDRPDDKAVMGSWAANALKEARIKFVNDAELVLAAGTPDGWGVALICGTGSIVYGCNVEGERTRAGGWGYLLGDEGSGYSIGLAALRAILRAYDERGQNTRLHSSILNHLSLTAPTELVKYIYRERVPTTEIASLSSLVETAADEGDVVAAQILQEAASELVLAVRSVTSRLKMSGAIPCALAGGVIVNGKSFREKFKESSNKAEIYLNPIEIVREPAIGAIRLAKRL